MGGMSLSELAGNVSFICAMAAFLNTDILVLRSLVMGGIGLSIIFQYYRTFPLWIPIRWNVALLGINAIMATKLLWERHRANQMSSELEALYRDAHFEKRGFSRVEFCKLFDLGNKVQLKAGDTVARDGMENTKLYDDTLSLFWGRETNNQKAISNLQRTFFIFKLQVLPCRRYCCNPTKRHKDCCCKGE